MANAVDESQEDVEIDPSEVSSKDRHNAEADKALDSVTDLVPERQLDENKVKKAMADLAASQKADKEAARQRERELAAVKVSKEDIDVVALEFEVDKKLAERRLRECSGNLTAALKSFL